MRSPLLLLGTLAYATMTIMAVILFEERIAFLDGAFILFSILSEGDLAIQVYRFGSAITQMVPLLASWMDFSLESIMKIYSACFPVYFYLLFLICLLGLKKERHAILLLLFNVGIVTHTFYWVIPEFQQGLSLMVVYFAFQEKAMEEKWFSNNKVWTHSINTGLICTLAFFHPLMIFPFAFFTGYFLLFSKNSPNYFNWSTLKNLLKPSSPTFIHWPLFLSTAFFIFFFLLKSLVFKTGYDSSSMGGLKNFGTLFPDYFKVQSNLNFLSYLVRDYYLLIVALVVIGVHAIRKKKTKWFLFIFLSFLGYLFLINISYPHGPHQFYIESLYLPLSLILFLPIIYEFFQRLNSKTFLFALSLIVIIRVVHIYQTHPFYSERIAYIREFINKTDKLPNKKLILNPKQVNEEKLLLHWGFAYECWLLSTIDKGVTRSIVVKNKPHKHRWLLKENKAFGQTWGTFSYEKLPERYFIFKDSSYYVIPEGDFNFK